MAKHKIGVGLIGYGYWGPNYARIISEHPRTELVSVSDLNQGLLKDAKLKYLAKLTTNYQDLLKDDSIDAVIVSTNATSHFKIVKDALLHGKHVLVEKPMTRTVREAEALIDLSQKLKLNLMVGHTFMFNPHFLQLKKITKAKSFGDLRFITSNRTNLGPIRQDVSVLWDLAPHDLSMILELVGDDPYEVYASGGFYLKNNNLDVGVLHLKFKRDVLANIVVSWLSPIKDRMLTVVGSKKMALFNDVSDQKLTIFNKGVTIPPRGSSFKEFAKFGIYQGKIEMPEVPFEEPLKNKIDHFIQVIESKMKLKVNGQDGWRVVRILEAADHSIRRNRPILL